MQQKRSTFWTGLVVALSLLLGVILMVAINRDPLASSTIQLTEAFAQIEPNSFKDEIPELISPADFEISTNPRPTLIWASVEGAVYYELRLSTGVDFRDGVTTSETSYTLERDLVVSGYANWYVRAYDANGTGSQWSETRRVGVASPPGDAPRLYRMTWDPELTWQGVTWATAYHLQIDYHEDFSSPIVDDMTIPADQESYALPLLSPQAGHYYWRMRAQHSDGTWGAWSTVSTFTQMSIPTRTPHPTPTRYPSSTPLPPPSQTPAPSSTPLPPPTRTAIPSSTQTRAPSSTPLPPPTQTPAPSWTPAPTATFWTIPSPTRSGGSGGE
ncbi:MAG: hypothetical protein K8L99_21415 [Anaerolineae bacterium]|nr:hypothetical protein [Anaerolineae bacterium]